MLVERAERRRRHGGGVVAQDEGAVAAADVPHLMGTKGSQDSSWGTRSSPSHPPGLGVIGEANLHVAPDARREERPLARDSLHVALAARDDLGSPRGKRHGHAHT